MDVTLANSFSGSNLLPDANKTIKNPGQTQETQVPSADTIIVDEAYILQHSANPDTVDIFKYSSPFRKTDLAKAQEAREQIQDQLAKSPGSKYLTYRFLNNAAQNAHEAGIADRFLYGINAAGQWKEAVNRKNPIDLRYAKETISWLNRGASTIGLVVPFTNIRDLIDPRGFHALFECIDPKRRLPREKVQKLMREVLDKVDGITNSNVPSTLPAISVFDTLPLVEFFDRGGGNKMPDGIITRDERLKALDELCRKLQTQTGIEQLQQRLQGYYKAMILPLVK